MVDLVGDETIPSPSHQSASAANAAADSMLPVGFDGLATMRPSSFCPDAFDNLDGRLEAAVRTAAQQHRFDTERRQDIR